jgi:hypothetical protein
MKLNLICAISLVCLSAHAQFKANSYDTANDAAVRVVIGSQVGGSNYTTRAEIAGSNYTTQAQIAGSNFVNTTQLAGSNYTTRAQIAGSNYTTQAQIAGSNYTTQAAIASSNFLNAAVTTGLTFVSPYQNNTNFYVDFTLPAQVLNTPTNLIVFNYATNWGLANTSLTANIFIQWTNYGRLIYFVNQATNWHVQPMVWFVPTGYGAKLSFTAFGSGDTNVVMVPTLDNFPSGSNTTASFNPTNAFPSIGAAGGGIGTKLWLDASLKAWQDEWLTVPAYEGLPVRGWTDLSGFVGQVTNMITTELNLYYHSPMLGPLNVPCMRVDPGQSGAFAWLQAPSIAVGLAQPTWVFVMYYGRSGGVVVDSTGGGRIAINPGQMGQGSSAFSSAGIAYTSAKTVNWQLIEYLANGASSAMWTNGVQAVTGNAGSTTPTQLIVFGDNVKSVQVGTYNVAEILILNTNLTAIQHTNVESYFYRKYPFWTPPTIQ